MGVNLWGESPLYENLKVFIVMDTNKSSSRRQGRLRYEGSEGSPIANVRDDGQKPRTSLSLWVSWHNTTKPIGSGDRVNAAFVHGKFTFLFVEICVSWKTVPSILSQWRMSSRKITFSMRGNK